MLTEDIKNKIKELFESTPPETAVFFGEKIKGNQPTGEYGFIFTVEKKIPLDEISSENILPSKIKIKENEYTTDVIEMGKMGLLACPPVAGTICTTNICNNCYSWYPNLNPSNELIHRPLLGGIGITSTQNSPGSGTMGFIAIDNHTNSLVGVTNHHVIVKNGFYSEYRNLNGLIENELNNQTYQPIFIAPQNKVGKTMRYVPIKASNTLDIQYNQVDGAIFSLSQSDIDFNESWKQYGLVDVTQPMKFATTAEIDSLLSIPNLEIISTGRSSGAKQGQCSLRIVGLTAAMSIYWVYGDLNQNNPEYVNYDSLILFNRINSTCPYPAYPGDSGSALIAKFPIEGQPGQFEPKIIGLVFAGSDFVGAACRIDKVAEQLNISAWTGQTANFIDESTQKYFTIPGKSLDKTLICSGETYWQVGITDIINQECDCGEIRLTFTANTNTTVEFYTNSPSASLNITISVNWGDGTTTIYSGDWRYIIAHTYSNAGTYEVIIGFDNCSNVSNFGIVGSLQNKSPLVNFSGFENLTSLVSIGFNYASLTNFNPEVQLPNSLKLLLISDNLLTNFNPTLPLPSGLNYLNLNGNFITTFNPTLPLPASLISLDLGGNRSTSFNPSLSLPSGLKTLNLAVNLITSFTPTLQLPLTLTNISLNTNPIDQTGINNALIYLDAIPWTSVPPKVIYLFNNIPTAIPSGAGLVAKNNLIGAGWTVQTN